MKTECSRAVPLLAALTVIACEPDTSIRVTSTVDGESGSLRRAIDQANQANTPVRIEVPSGTYELTRCAEDDTNSGGDLDLTTNAQVRLEATGPDVVIRQTCPGRVLDAHGSGVLTVVGMTLSGGNAEGADGGAIKGGSVVLSGVTLSGNTAARGGGIACSTLTADQLTAVGNRAWDRGGGVFVTTKAVIQRADVRWNNGRLGAGLAVGELVISQSRVMQNQAEYQGPGTGSDGDQVGGVGIWAGSVVGNAVTVSGNYLAMCTHIGPDPQNTMYSRGAGIRAGRVSLVNSTVSENYGPPPSCVLASPPFFIEPVSGIAVYADEVELEHVTLVGNFGGDSIHSPRLTVRTSVAIPGDGKLCESPPQTESYNSWFADTSCNLTGSGNRQEAAEFLLGPLVENGGSVPTHAPALGSPLIDAVPLSVCRPATDARGITRPQGPRCDIGAVEVVQAPELGPANLGVSFRLYRRP